MSGKFAQVRMITYPRVVYGVDLTLMALGSTDANFARAFAASTPAKVQSLEINVIFYYHITITFLEP